jgi:hypothetical protein
MATFWKDLIDKMAQHQVAGKTYYCDDNSTVSEREK